MTGSEELGVRVGFGSGTACTTVDQVRADASWAAATGFDSYWVSYVFGVDPLVALPAVALEAPGIELGTSVVPTVGRHPIAMAQLARSAQQLCDGRFTLGVGPSHEIVVEAIYGEQWDRPFARTREYLDALVPLCNGEPASTNGEQVTANVTLNIPCEPVPVVLAALGPNMLTLAGQVAAGTHVGQCGPKTIAEHTVPTITAAAEAAGRPAPRIIALVGLCVGDPDTVRSEAAPGAAAYASLPSYRAMLDREGITNATDLILAGSMSDIADGLASYAEAGVTDIRIGIATADPAGHQATRDALTEWMT